MYQKSPLLFLIIVSTISALLCLGVSLYNSITYDREVEGFLKQAADANTTELAEQKIAQAIDGMDARNLCNKVGDAFPTCSSAIFYDTPATDIGYWRTNIEATYKDLASMDDDDRQDHLTESNQLMKVRETLLDAGDGGDEVTSPPSISNYPIQGLMFWWGLISFLITCGGFIVYPLK